MGDPGFADLERQYGEGDCGFNGRRFEAKRIPRWARRIGRALWHVALWAGIILVFATVWVAFAISVIAGG
jgi:type IV secretory pathway component VirB8